MYELALGESSTFNSPNNVSKQKLPRIEVENIIDSFISLSSVTMFFIYFSHSNLILFGFPLYANRK